MDIHINNSFIVNKHINLTQSGRNNFVSKNTISLGCLPSGLTNRRYLSVQVFVSQHALTSLFVPN